MDFHPGLLIRWVVGVQGTNQAPQMLTRVIEIDNLHGAGKMQIRQIPDPFGSVTHDYLLFRAAPATVPGLPIEAFSKLFGSLDASRVCAGWPSAFPLRPSVSFFTTGMPVPSICTYRIGIGSPTMMGRSS